MRGRETRPTREMTLLIADEPGSDSVLDRVCPAFAGAQEIGGQGNDGLAEALEIRSACLGGADPLALT